MSEAVTKTTEPDGLSIEQIKLARQLGPQMLEILAGWQSCEARLSEASLGFRDRLRAAREMRGLFRSGEAIVARVINLGSDADVG